MGTGSSNRQLRILLWLQQTIVLMAEAYLGEGAVMKAVTANVMMAERQKRNVLCAVTRRQSTGVSLSSMDLASL